MQARGSAGLQAAPGEARTTSAIRPARATAARRRGPRAAAPGPRARGRSETSPSSSRARGTRNAGRLPARGPRRGRARRESVPPSRKIQEMFFSRRSASYIQRPYRRLSACARGDHTAGPRLRLSTLNWMPVASMARPINPPSASISATRWPLAVPPMAGLQGMCATVSGDSVQMATLRPRRAAAYAASHPACPAPITITSNFSAIVFATLYHRGHRGKTEQVFPLHFQNPSLCLPLRALR